jgi:hypothetical protein
MNIYDATKMLFDILANVEPGFVNVTYDKKRIVVIWKSVIPGRAPNYFDGYEVVQIHSPDKVSCQ